ncbi:hypothetical protein [Umezawaea sp.]|uniref:hypothetical protein n=1 Tax=Umezawaea sp. TaxID=1955258 RepID=UPI002ED523E8
MPIRTNPATRRRVTGDTGHHDLLLHRMGTSGNSDRDIPGRVTVVLADEGHLFLDQVPIPRDAWTYDEHDRVLTWRGAYGGGTLLLAHDGRGAHGTVGPAHDLCSVAAGARAQFLCDVALDCGAGYVSAGNQIVGLAWDPASTEWTGATWVPKRLLLTYTVTPGGPLQPPTFTFEFNDTGARGGPWDPGSGAFSATLQLGERGDEQAWDLTFRSLIPPQPDRGKPGPASVYPWWLQAAEDTAALGIDGVLVVDENAPDGTLVGFRGLRPNAAVAGYYRTSTRTAPFGVFDGRLVVGGAPVPDAVLVGDRLTWADLSPALRERTGLPASGSLVFADLGSTATTEDGTVRAVRLDAATALTAITQHRDLHRAAHRLSLAHAKAIADPALDMYSLLAMTPFAKDDKGVLRDQVQGAVTQDLSDIMNSFIPTDLWKLVFPDTNQTTLTGDLAEIANSPVAGVDDPVGWYRSLATAVLTHGLANGSEEHCRNLNGPRAQAWLTTEVARSKVYAAHGQRLFTLRWQEHCPLTASYLRDQITNAATYRDTITTVVADAITDIQDNVITDSTSVPDLKKTMIADVQEAGQYADTNELYWAFAYYTYNTAPAILANIAVQMAYGTGSGDGTGLSRLLQQNVAVLTALDPSGFFAQRYVRTLNTFLATNVLPSMFGFLGDAMSFDLIEEYLQQFVANNIANEDRQIAEAAAQIDALLKSKDADTILHDSIEALQEISSLINDTLALPYIASKWVDWFTEKYPRFSAMGSMFGTALIGGITMLGVSNLINGFKNWSDLDKDERADLVLNAVQFGVQLVAAVVKRGIRIYAIFSVEGMTSKQRTAAVSRILMTGEADRLESGLIKIGNSTARWLGDTQGMAEYLKENPEVLERLLDTQLTTDAEEVGWAAKVFGANLDEFLANRLGPVLIVAGMVVSVVRLAEGESTIDTWADALNIVGGALMLMAFAGEGMAEGALASALAFAGPLAILVALAGLGLMLYEMFKKQPDPVEDFVDGYAKPAGFWVPSSKTALDYAVPFENPDRGSLMMMGFTLSTKDGTLRVHGDGSVLPEQRTALPDCVWQATTDGFGMSTIATVVQQDQGKPPVVRYLSLLEDGTVAFRPRWSPLEELVPVSTPRPKQPDVITQVWLGEPWRDATLTSDGKDMVSLPLRFQPVPPDANGGHSPDRARDWLAVLDGKLVVTDQVLPTGDPFTPVVHGSVFTLDMSGMAPNYTTMVDLTFRLDTTPSTVQVFGPSFAVVPSTPLSYTYQGDALPAFLGFDPKTGTFRPNGQKADHGSRTRDSIIATNACGSGSATFSITVAQPISPLIPNS